MNNLIVYNNDYGVTMNNLSIGNMNTVTFTNYLGSKTTKTDSGFILPERVWFIGGGDRGVFKDTLAKAKITAGTFRPHKKVVVVEFDLVTGQRNVIMDYVPPDNCEDCQTLFPQDKYSRRSVMKIDPLSDTQFAGAILCPTCYENNLKIVLLRRKR